VVDRRTRGTRLRMSEVTHLDAVSTKTLHEGRSDILWGIDFSTKAASIGWVDALGSSRGVVTAVWDHRLRDAARLRSAYDTIKECADNLCGLHPAVAAGVEQPSGTFNKLTLSYMAGIVQMAIFDSLDQHWGRPAHVFIINSTTWKKGVVAADGFAANGGFGKPKKGADPETYPGAIWAREHGYEGNDENEADAYCLAEGVRREVRFG
jgi:hypothetical protein